MKNLPCIILAAAPTGLVVLTVTSSLGVSLPFALTAGHYVAVSAAAGVLAMFCHDYVPRSRRRPTPVQAPARKPVVAPAPRPAGCLFASLRLTNDPATVSLT